MSESIGEGHNEEEEEDESDEDDSTEGNITVSGDSKLGKEWQRVVNRALMKYPLMKYPLMNCHLHF